MSSSSVIRTKNFCPFHSGNATDSLIQPSLKAPIRHRGRGGSPEEPPSWTVQLARLGFTAHAQEAHSAG